MHLTKLHNSSHESYLAATFFRKGENIFEYKQT